MNNLQLILKKQFQIDQLRENQQVIIDEILKGENVLVLLPTGAGKSLTFQLPMIVMQKKTIVISPLIALMEDQVMQLKQKKIKACCIHSHLPHEDKKMILSQIEHYDFIYCSPEWLAVNGMAYLKSFPCEAIVIDEAHCISEWGYEFRPHYLLIDEFIQYFNAQVIALTATADEHVVKDIKQVVNKDLLILDFLKARENIFLSVIHTQNDEEKLSNLLDILKESGPTIIYFSSKKQVEYVYQYLNEKQLIAERYHADMVYEDRMSVQQRFMNDEIQIICATNAFGMGVNKSNIRTVIHYQMPKSMFQFIQEIGRGGRDGLLCQSILLYSEHDEMLSYRLNEMNELTEAEINLYYEGVTIAEEKQILMQILSNKYDKTFINHKIRQHQQMKRKGTQRMLQYIQGKHCYFENLYEFSSTKNERKINCQKERCALCKMSFAIKFEQVDYKVQQKSKKTLLNQLFNHLYDFT